MPSLLKSPTLHFVVAGTVLFALFELLRPSPRETISITSQTIDALVQNQEGLSLTPVTDDERNEIIAGHIQDEILIREAYKRGFDKNDGRVRERILRIMRSSLSEAIPEPSTPQLRAYFDEHAERYMMPASRTFEQVYFEFGSARLPADPEAFKSRLTTANLGGLGDFALMPNRIERSPFSSVAGQLGKPFAEFVFGAPIGAEWLGPVESSVGIHYVRVVAEHEPQAPDFESLENYVRTDYMMTKSRESQQARIEELGKGYRVLIDGVEQPE